MRICFLGTPDFSVPSLEALVLHHDVVAVFSQPDRPKGRKQVLEPTPTKICAQKHNIPIFQPEKIREQKWVDILKEYAPDFIVTAAFGQILSQEVLDVPKYGTINVHGSLLPKYRGAAPIQWAIINGETKTGVTTMFTDIGIDTGDMLLKSETDILPGETAGELFTRLSIIGSQLLIKTISAVMDKTITPEKQIQEDSSYYPMLKKEMAKIDFKKSAKDIVNLIHGMNPWPICYFSFNGQNIKVYTAQLIDDNSKNQPGEVLFADSKNGIIIGCEKGKFKVITLQTPGKNPMSAKDWLNGNKLTLGDILC